MRGLKLIYPNLNFYYVSVAPLAGAWIEIKLRLDKAAHPQVAPLAGAWIEIFFHLNFNIFFLQVAPLAGAWIEMLR